jgi:nucleotide-binding universal stress UspA family protein
MRVLVGVDGSSNSFAAVEFVGRLLSAERDELVLLYAAPEMSIADDDRLDSAVIERARNALSKAILDEAMQRLPPHLHSRLTAPAPVGEGLSPGATLLEAIDKHKADVIAVGFRGTSGIVEDFVLGSVSRTVVHSAKVPVLVVKSAQQSDAPAKQSPGPATKHLHVLTAFDDPTFVEPAASLLKRFTWPPESRGWAMTVVRPMFVTDLPDWVKIKRNADVAAMAAAWEVEHQQSLQAARIDLEKFRAQLPAFFAKEELVVAEGRPAEEILAQTRDKSIDLVVMGSRGRGGFKRLLLGSTSEQVLREAPCSVLIVR